MPASPPPETAWQREFLGIRCRLIELAASLDRIDRAGDLVPDEPQWSQIRHSLEILGANAPNRAAQVQMVFSKRD